MYIFSLFFSVISWILIIAYQLPPSIHLEIPMRDGTTLSADLYLPYPEAKNVPCLLVRSPSGKKNPYALLALTLLKEGYAVVIQDTRSAYDKEKIPYISDGWGEHQDGYDTVEYLAKSPYTNGKIGTLGASAMGVTQLLMAPTNPPSLKAQYVAFATSDLFNHGLYQDGELLKHQVEGWLSYYAFHPTIYQTICCQPEYNEFWSQFNMLPLASQCCTPALHVAGWYDTFLKGTLDAYEYLQNNGGKGAKGKQKLIVGPWIHLWPFITKLGEFEYPEVVNNPPYDFKPEKWFAYFLKDEQNGVEQFPTVAYYVMGPLDGSSSSGNVWKTASEWPVPHEKKEFYLTKDHALNRETKEDFSFSYKYDPNNPIPTIGGRNLFLPSGPFDQKSIEDRSDVIVFTTPPLEKDLEITGEITATLFVSTDQEDTDFSVRLTDCYPDGKSVLIADGMSRLSHATKRNGSVKAPHQVDIDLWSTALVFAKGHQIKVIVSSSNYPRYEKNFNTRKRAHENPQPVVANNTIYVGKDYPSRLTLPVVNSSNK